MKGHHISNIQCRRGQGVREDRILKDWVQHSAKNVFNQPLFNLSFSPHKEPIDRKINKSDINKVKQL